MILPKFYCPHCKRFLKRKEVNSIFGYHMCRRCRFEALETEKYIGKMISDYRDWERGKEFKVDLVDLKIHHK